MNGNSGRAGKYRIFCVSLLGGLLLGAGCASHEREFDKSDAGQILGGVAGAAVGSQIGEGSGQTVATVAGALIGAVVGERIGAKMEDDDRAYTAQVLEENRTGESESWVNPDTGNEFEVTPTDTYSRSGQPCREFDFRVETDRGSNVEKRTACRESDGSWNVIG